MANLKGVIQLEDGNAERVYLPRMKSDLYTATQGQKERDRLEFFAIPQALRLAINGVEGMHGRNIVHRDLKGDNVLVDIRGAFDMGAGVADFDFSFDAPARIAKRDPSSGRKLKPGKEGDNRPKGTPGFFAPEQLDEYLEGETPLEKIENAKKADSFAEVVMVAESFGIARREIEKLRDCHYKGAREGHDLSGYCGQQLKDLTNKLRHEEACNGRDIPDHLCSFLVPYLNADVRKRPHPSKFKTEFYELTLNHFMKGFGSDQGGLGWRLLRNTQDAIEVANRKKKPVFVPEEDEKGLLRLRLIKPGFNANEKPIYMNANPRNNREAFEEEVKQKLKADKK